MICNVNYYSNIMTASVEEQFTYLMARSNKFEVTRIINKDYIC